MGAMDLVYRPTGGAGEAIESVDDEVVAIKGTEAAGFVTAHCMSKKTFRDWSKAKRTRFTGVDCRKGNTEAEFADEAEIVIRERGVRGSWESG